MKHFAIFIYVVLFSTRIATAQTTHFFSEGLGAGPMHQYGREALYRDQLAYQLYKGTIVSPKAGVLIGKDEKGNEVKWNEVKTDTAHRFRGDAFSNGYIYLTYDSKKEQTAILNVTGNDMTFVNGVPRGGDVYRYGWMNLPIKLKKGKNQFYVRVARFGRFGGVTAKLVFPEKPVFLSTEDLTMPNAVPGLKNDSLWTGLVVVNTSAKPLAGLSVKSEVSGNTMITEIPVVPAMSTRKVGVLINGNPATSESKSPAAITLIHNGKNIDTKTIELETTARGKQYSRTFISEIDGSVQYYAVSPQTGSGDGKQPALFLSVHGAEVQAINQARAYKPKDWGTVVAPTNRRPRGFNWEDWGRLDALEVLGIAKQQYKPDPAHIYLTGHSMGGHGTWFLGATYPDKWAAIAPSAGYPTLSSYGSHDGMIPDSARSPMEAILLRASNASNVLALANNYKSLGVYIAHGDADRTVSVNYARDMKKLLATFHPDFSYYERPGGGHWYSDESVDWPPIFNFFSWHSIPKDTAVQHIEFITANPGVSHKMRWGGIHQQLNALKYSRFQLDRDFEKKTITGTTQNVALLSLDLTGFKEGDLVSIRIDSLAPVSHKVAGSSEVLYIKKEKQWSEAVAPDGSQKGINRNGTLKDAFQHRMIFVYATGGSAEENTWAQEKAKYDSETWYYRGNGAVELIADKDFDPTKFQDRGVILYGSSDSNLAWDKLLKNCPVKVTKGKVLIGDKEFRGEDLAVNFIWPLENSKTSSVTVITGTGRNGRLAANANQYFSGGSGFADLMIFSLEMLKDGMSGVKMAGFFGNDWSVAKGEFEINE